MSKNGDAGREPNILNQLWQMVQIAFDVISCFLLSLPVTFITVYKMFATKSKNVAGKLVLVTGGGNGLGRAISLKLAKKGSNIIIADVNMKAAEETAADIQRLGVKAKAYLLDVTNADEITKLRDQISSDFGPVDILINNAGLMSNHNLDEKPENIERMVKVNLLGPLLMTKCFLEQMKEKQSGHIVSICSMSGIHPTPFSIPYTATKFGVHGFMSALTEHLRLEGWRSKIKTTCIFPYYIKTRNDVTDFLNPNIRFPALETDETADEVVGGILREDFNLTVPSAQKPLTKFLNILPLRIQEIVRDRVLRERSFANKDCKLNFDFK